MGKFSQSLNKWRSPKVAAVKEDFTKNSPIIPSSPDDLKKQVIHREIARKNHVHKALVEMRELYLQRILHDFIMLNPGIDLTLLYSNFFEKPLLISKYMNALIHKNKVRSMTSSGQKPQFYTMKNDFCNNLILAKMQPQSGVLPSDILSGLMQGNFSRISFLSDHLQIQYEDGVVLQITITNWRKK